MTLSCQHHFCDYCVSRQTQGKCPTCNTPFWQRDAVANHMLDRVVSSVKMLLRRYSENLVVGEGWLSPKWSTGTGTYVDSSIFVGKEDVMYIKMIANVLNSYNPGLAMYRKILQSRQEDMLKKNKQDMERLEQRRKEEEEAQLKAVEVKRLIEAGNKAALLVLQKRQQSSFASWSLGWAGGMLGEDGLESSSEEEDEGDMLSSAPNPSLEATLSLPNSTPGTSVHNTYSLNGGSIYIDSALYYELTIPEIFTLLSIYACTQPPCTYLYCEDAALPITFLTSCMAELISKAAQKCSLLKWTKPTLPSSLYSLLTRKVRMDQNTCYELVLQGDEPVPEIGSQYFNRKIHLLLTEYYHLATPRNDKDYRRECYYTQKSTVTRLFDRQAVFMYNALYLPLHIRSESVLSLSRTLFPSCEGCSRWCFAGLGDQQCACSVARVVKQAVLPMHMNPVFQALSEYIVLKRQAQGLFTTSADIWVEGMKIQYHLYVKQENSSRTSNHLIQLPLSVIAGFAAICEPSPLDISICGNNAYISPLQNLTVNIQTCILTPILHREKILTEELSLHTAKQRDKSTISCTCNIAYKCSAHMSVEKDACLNNPLLLHKMLKRQELRGKDQAGDTQTVHIPGIKTYLDKNTLDISGLSPEIVMKLSQLACLQQPTEIASVETTCIVLPDVYLQVPASIATLMPVMTAELALYQPSLPMYTHTIEHATEDASTMTHIDVNIQPYSYTRNTNTRKDIFYISTKKPIDSKYAYLALSSYHTYTSPPVVPGYTPYCLQKHILPCPLSGHVAAYNYTWRTSLLAPCTPLMRFTQTPSTQKQEAIPQAWCVCEEMPGPIFDKEDSIPLQLRAPLPFSLQTIVQSHLQYLFTLQHHAFTAPHKSHIASGATSGKQDVGCVIEYNKLYQTVRIAQDNVVVCLDAKKQMQSEQTCLQICLNLLAFAPLVDVHVCASQNWQYKAEQRAYYTLQGNSQQNTSNTQRQEITLSSTPITTTLSSQLASFSLIRMMQQGYVPTESVAFTTVQGQTIPPYIAMDHLMPSTLQFLLPYRTGQALRQYYRRAMLRRSSTQELIQPLYSYAYLQTMLETNFFQHVTIYFYEPHRTVQDVPVEQQSLLVKQRGATVVLQGNTSDLEFLEDAAVTLKNAMVAERTVLGHDPGVSPTSLAKLYTIEDPAEAELIIHGVRLPSPILPYKDTFIDYTTTQPLETRQELTQNPPKPVYNRKIPPKTTVLVSVSPFFFDRASPEEQTVFLKSCRNTILTDKYLLDCIRHGALQPIEAYIK